MTAIIWTIVAVVALLGILTVLAFCGYKSAKEWLFYAVVETEKSLGSGTGAVKLHTVYNAFLSKFPVMKILLPYPIFTKMVDKALAEMKKVAADAPAVQTYINGKKQNEPATVSFAVSSESEG